MISIRNISKSCPLFLLLVSCFFAILLFAGGSDGASTAGAKKEETASVSSSISSDGVLPALSKGDLGRIFQLLADNYKREVSQEEGKGNHFLESFKTLNPSSIYYSLNSSDELSLRPASMYLSMLSKRGNNGDDYGHLRFGRSGSTRIKYNDPDYGHMRFGRK